ncbi:TKL/TKL-CCIN protein kinase [Allomyces macrogynus ATCC 38327]|uniref:TKL/TKL-CCIN protein kinase n=1 Tax=Allomyces macrogynus (strain ATCC 38327) TaxID=578462 RepID=A0A0L0T3F0_ALLM3|nr:TKL/TKL-CCIN protein kinase [Allomyces macrogynus ATCC 38327]|eukprot:KNE69368.1 TKL/TKL-CCIN protein kinase [Allomyces macrogynus ATCC 38327]
MPSISTNSSYVVSSTSSNRATAAAVQDGDQLRPVATQSPDALPLRPLLTRLKVEAEQPVHAAHQNLLNFVARMAGTVYETLQDQFASTGRSELWDQLYKILIRVDAAMTVGDAITQLVRLEMDNAVLFNAVRQLARLASAIKKLSWATDLGQQLPAVGEKKIDVQAEPMADVEEEIWTEAAKDFDVQLKQLRDLDALTDDDLAAALRLRPSDRLEALAAVGKVLQKPSIAAVSKHLPRAVGAQVIVLDAQLRQTARRIQVTLEQAVPAADRAASSARTTQLDHLAVTAHEFIVDQEPFARGGFAELYRATWIARNSDEVVMKRLLPSAVLGKTMRDDLAKEARAWAAVHHEHVLPLLGVCLAANAPFLITPYMPYGTLVEYAETRPKEHTRLLLEVSLGMAHIHRCGIAHGDLKGNNVLVDVDGVAKVTDFGLARFAADASRTTLRNNQGPVRWLAPERLEPGNKRVYEPDVYAFAMLCYEVVAGRAPFYEQPSDIVVLSWIQRGDRPTAPMAAASYSPALWGIVAQCWAQNPAVRPSFCAVAGMLHPLVPGAPPLAADVAARCVAETAAKHEQREKELCAVIELLEKRLNDANARSAQVEVLKERARDADARVAQVENKARQDEEKRLSEANALSAQVEALKERVRDADARVAQVENKARQDEEKRLNEANARSAQVEVLKERVRDADARVAQVENKARQDEEKRSAAIDQLEKRTRDADALARRESERATAAAERARDAEARAAQAESRARRESERADMAVAAADRMRTEIATERSCRADSDRAAAQARQECERERSARVTAENEVERLRRQLRDIPSPSPSPSPGYGFGFGPAFMSFDMGGQGGGGGGGGRRVMHCSICGMAGTNASTHPHHGRR